MCGAWGTRAGAPSSAAREAAASRRGKRRRGQAAEQRRAEADAAVTAGRKCRASGGRKSRARPPARTSAGRLGKIVEIPDTPQDARGKCPKIPKLGCWPGFANRPDPADPTRRTRPGPVADGAARGWGGDADGRALRRRALPVSDTGEHVLRRLELCEPASGRRVEKPAAKLSSRRSGARGKIHHAKSRERTAGKSPAVPGTGDGPPWKVFTAPENADGPSWKVSTAPENADGPRWKVSAATGPRWKVRPGDPERRCESTPEPPCEPTSEPSCGPTPEASCEPTPDCPPERLAGGCDRAQSPAPLVSTCRPARCPGARRWFAPARTLERVGASASNMFGAAPRPGARFRGPGLSTSSCMTISAHMSARFFGWRTAHQRAHRLGFRAPSRGVAGARYSSRPG